MATGRFNGSGGRWTPFVGVVGGASVFLLALVILVPPSQDRADVRERSPEYPATETPQAAPDELRPTRSEEVDEESDDGSDVLHERVLEAEQEALAQAEGDDVLPTRRATSVLSTWTDSDGRDRKHTSWRRTNPDRLVAISEPRIGADSESEEAEESEESDVEEAGDVPDVEEAEDVPNDEEAEDVPNDEEAGDVPNDEEAGDASNVDEAGDAPHVDEAVAHGD